MKVEVQLGCCTSFHTYATTLTSRRTSDLPIARPAFHQQKTNGEMDTDMDGTNLTGGPSETNLSDFQHHTLRLHYPAIELLPPGKQPFVEIPHGVADREEPEISPLGLSAGDLDFFVRFPSEHSLTVDDSPGKRQKAVLTGPQPLNLTASIGRLSTFAGVSDLRFASFIDDWDVITRFQLKTTFFTNFGKLEDPAQEFELGSADVAKLIRTMSGEEEWVRLLDDVLNAKTDRAYLYRYKTLADWDSDWADDEEERWVVDWDSRKVLNTRERFARRLVCLYQGPDGSVVKEALPPLEDFRDQEVCVEMPCGHRSVMSANYIHDMRPREAFTAVCDECNQRILSRKDVQRLEYLYKRLRCWKWEDANIDWIAKCKRVRNDSSLVEISSGMLSGSLLNALNTFETPESICPRSLCPNTYPESGALLNKLVNTLKAHSTLPAMTPKAMFANLEKLAWQSVEEMIGDATLLAVVLPPGFDDFVSRWMTRTVNDAVGNQADDESNDELMDVMTKMNRTKIDPKAVAVESDFDDILKQIGETSLNSAANEGEEETPNDDQEDDDEL